MAFEGCELLLDNPESTYYSGQTVKGKVKLDFMETQNLRGIKISFMGEANTEWPKANNESTYCSGYEEYLNEDFYIMGNKHNPPTELPAGTYIYPFTYVLPPDLPSSLESEYGNIRYTIKATLDLYRRSDPEVIIPFIVIVQVDLNQHQWVKEPVYLYLTKSTGCLCCRSVPLWVEVSVPATGYLSGQSMPITCVCDNYGKVNISSIKFELQKVITFRTDKPHKDKRESKEVVAELSTGSVASGETQTFTLQLKIPPLPPSDVFIHLIDVVYELLVQCNLSGPNRNLTDKIPITLGTIPFSNASGHSGSRGKKRKGFKAAANR